MRIGEVIEMLNDAYPKWDYTVQGNVIHFVYTFDGVGDGSDDLSDQMDLLRELMKKLNAFRLKKYRYEVKVRIRTPTHIVTYPEDYMRRYLT